MEPVNELLERWMEDSVVEVKREGGRGPVRRLLAT